MKKRCQAYNIANTITVFDSDKHKIYEYKKANLLYMQLRADRICSDVKKTMKIHYNFCMPTKKSKRSIYIIAKNINKDETIQGIA